MYDHLLYPAFFVAAMYVGAMNSKALAPTIALCMGLLTVYPDETKAGFLFILYIPAVLLAMFRE